MKKTVLIFVQLILLVSCNKYYSNSIRVRQIKSTYPIIIRGDTATNRIVAINFPLAYIIKNTSKEKVRILPPPSYFWNSLYCKKQGYYSNALLCYTDEKKQLKTVDINTDEALICDNEKIYIVYTEHYKIDTKSSKIQSIFLSNINEMKTKVQDTLHIESIQQLKQSNPELVNGFLQGDSIRFVFHYDKKFQTITLPVEVK